MVVAAGGNECGLIAIALHHFKAEHAAVEAESAFEVGDFQMDMPDACTGSNRRKCIGHDPPPESASGRSGSSL
jgi:hypothetical protein